MRPYRLESRMREIRPSGLEGGVALTRHPYPYRFLGRRGPMFDRWLLLRFFISVLRSIG